jgi:regulatory protein
MTPRKRASKPKKLDESALWDYSLRTLSARALSTGEIRVRLNRRAEDPASVDRILARLKEAHYLDDKRFAESFSTSRLENQGLGRQRVVRDLRQRRVAPALAEKSVADAYAGTDEVELIEQYIARKFRNRDLPRYLAEPNNLASAFRKLRYAGFSAGNAIRVLRRYSEMADELESEEETIQNENRGD